MGDHMHKLLIFVLLLTALAVAQEPFPASPQVSIKTTWNAPVGGTTWHAHNSSDLTADFAAASPGDIIVLDAGTIYTGNFTFLKKANPTHQWIYIESSALASLPAPHTRVSPADAPNMPKLVTPNAGPAIRLCGAHDDNCSTDGVNYLRFVGVEVYSASTATASCYSNQTCNPFTNFLIQSESDDNGGTDTLADHITFDRCYIHGSPTEDVYHAIGANGTYFAVIDSYVSEIHASNTDSQAILAYYTPGPIKIDNNYLSATTENIMFGGAGACYETGCSPATNNP